MSAGSTDTPSMDGLNEGVGLNNNSEPCQPVDLDPAAVSFSLYEANIKIEHLGRRELDEKPWKYVGYRRYTEFLASDNDFLVFRRFNTVSTRVALMLQHQVSILEAKLDLLDTQYSRRDAVDVNNGSFRDDEEDRLQVLEELRVKLLEYIDEFMLQQAQIKQQPKSSLDDIQSLRTWHSNHSNCAISEEEQSYLHYPKDLFSLVPKEKSPLRRFLERSRNFRSYRLWRSKNAPELPLHDEHVIYVSDKKIERFVTAVIVMLGMIMLIAPMWILQALDGRTLPKLGTITAFIVTFLMLVSYATLAKPFETLAATAAYAAVLTVFLQFGGSSSAVEATTT